MPLFAESINRQLIELNQYPAYLVGKSVELICRDTSHPSHAGFCTHQKSRKKERGQTGKPKYKGNVLSSRMSNK